MGKLRILKSILIIAAVCAVIFLGLVFIFKVDEVTVTGNVKCSEEQIKNFYTSGTLGDNTLVIRIKDKLNLFGALPFVRDADINVSGTNKLNITVYEKALVGCFYYDGAYVYFDKDGMVLETGAERNDGLPCIEGLACSGYRLNEVLKLDEKDQLKAVLNLSDLINHYNIKIDKIEFDQNNEVALYYKDIKVLLGKRDLYDQQIASVSGVLKKAKKKGFKGLIDMRDYQRGDNIIIKQDKKSKDKDKKKE